MSLGAGNTSSAAQHAGPTMSHPHADADETAFGLWFDALREASADFVWAGIFVPDAGAFTARMQSAADPRLVAALQGLLRTAAGEKRLKVSVLSGHGSTPQTAMAMPLHLRGGVEAVCIAVQDRKLIEASRVAPLFEAAVGQLEAALARPRTGDAPQAPGQDAPAVQSSSPFSAEDCLELLAAPTPQAFAEQLFLRLSAAFAPTMAVLVHVRKSRISVLRTSQRQDFLPHGSRTGQARRAAILAAASGFRPVAVSWQGEGDLSASGPELELLCQQEAIAGAVTVCLPHASGGNFVFLAEYEAPRARIAGAPLAQLAERIAAFAPALGAMRDGGRRFRLFDALPVWLDPRSFRPWLLAGAAALALWLVLPAPFQIVGEATLRASEQKAVVAPRDGYLIDVYVKAGDLVSAGDVIAEFDTRELILRRARALAQIEQARSRRLSAIAAFNTAMVQVTDAEINALVAERDLVDLLLEQSRIIAAEDSVVVSGDMDERVGSAMRKGEMMFQLGPLSSFTAAVTVPQMDINETLAGQQGELRLTALPFETFPIHVERISATTDAETGVPAFLAMAEIGAAHEAFRPGMQGVAHIHAGEATRIWTLTREFVFWLRMQWWRWVP